MSKVITYHSIETYSFTENRVKFLIDKSLDLLKEGDFRHAYNNYIGALWIVEHVLNRINRINKYELNDEYNNKLCKLVDTFNKEMKIEFKKK